MMVTMLHNVTIYQDKNQIRILNGWQTVSNNKACAPLQDADLILVLVDGDIVEYGSHQDLMARKGKYYQMQKAAAFRSE
mgnify:CR=1 FL=1